MESKQEIQIRSFFNPIKLFEYNIAQEMIKDMVSNVKRNCISNTIN